MGVEGQGGGAGLDHGGDGGGAGDGDVEEVVGAAAGLDQGEGAARSQENRAATSCRAAAAMRERRSRLSNKWRHCAANSAWAPAMQMAWPGFRPRPSAPTAVDTTGVPAAKASQIFMRVPLPMRNGTTDPEALHQ